MKRNVELSEKENFNNLYKLLNDNILTSSDFKSPKYSKNFYIKTDPINYKRNKGNSELDYNKNKIISFSMVKYKPKRLIDFKNVNIPLPTLGKSSLDYTKTFVSQYKTIKKAQTDTLCDYKTVNTNNSQSKIEHIIKDDKLIEFKNIFILKYAEYSEEFSKFQSYKEYISDARKREFENSVSKIIKNLDIQSHILLDDYDNENKLTEKNNKNISSPYITSTSMTQSDKNLFSSNNNNYKINKKKITAVCSDYSNLIIKLINLLFRELKDYKNEIMKLIKVNHEQELKTNLITKELDDLKHYVNKYNIDQKIYAEKAKEDSIRKIKDKYAIKENEYFISIYKLKEEIHSLIKLLDKNKDYYNKFKQVKKEVLDSKKNNAILRLNFNRQLHQKDVLLSLERDKQEELLDKLERLNNFIKKFDNEKENQKRQEIEIKTQIKQMNIILDEKSENIMMMSEELEQYIRELNREKYNHQNTLTALKNLENRLFKEENEEDKKQEKEDIQLKL